MVPYIINNNNNGDKLAVHVLQAAENSPGRVMLDANIGGRPAVVILRPRELSAVLQVLRGMDERRELECGASFAHVIDPVRGYRVTFRDGNSFTIQIDDAFLLMMALERILPVVMFGVPVAGHD